MSGTEGTEGTEVAAAAVTEVTLAPDICMPRVFNILGKPCANENGVARDMLKAGMIAVFPGAARPEDERFVLTSLAFEAVPRLIGHDRLVDLGVLDPD